MIKMKILLMREDKIHQEVVHIVRHNLKLVIIFLRSEIFIHFNIFFQFNSNERFCIDKKKRNFSFRCTTFLSHYKPWNFISLSALSAAICYYCFLCCFYLCTLVKLIYINDIIFIYKSI
jgi:hypothetical protein